MEGELADWGNLLQKESGPQAQVFNPAGHSRVVCGFTAQLTSFPLALDSGCFLDIGHILKRKF